MVKKLEDMRLVFFTVAATSTLALVIHACADSENEVPRFCWGGLVLYQNYCPNFINYSHQYTCVGGSSLGCACKTLFRAINGACVKKEECDTHAHGHSDIASGKRIMTLENAAPQPTEKTTNVPTDTVVGPRKTVHETVVRADGNYKTAKELIESSDVLELLMMSEELWVHHQCLCLKSTWMANGVNTVDRSLDCYAERTRLTVPDTIAHLAGTKRLIKM
ncbi:uncharacterized protein LOC142767777 [Rhipicephalus microplus]|uniref:uncharacterized protein LOC142767777 n=1 Tax=Rhipicephalus microplus TaxID=6941 RepID=UPI003F6B3B24